jgi:pilus assembly protein CpaC
MRGAGRTVSVAAHSILWLVTVVVVLGSFEAAVAASDPGGDEIVLIVGRSAIIRAPWPTVRVAVTDPKVANIQALTPDQVLVQGLSIGTTDVILWGEGEQQSQQQRVVVKMDLEAVRQRLQQLFPTASLQLTEAGEVLVLQGQLRSADDAEQLSRFLESAKLTHVNMTSVAGVQQVELQVRVAEVSRQALRSLGINWFATGNDAFVGQRVGGSGAGAIVPASIGVPADTPATGNLPFQFLSDTSATPGVSLFAGFPRANLEVFLQALAENQYLRILANPTLVSLSGEQADFLAGGEFPIPVIQSGAGGAAGNAITIEYKEFGVRLSFRPAVLGDGGIRLRAMQEVSQLSSVGARVISGFEVPSLVTRRAEATLELQSGQSFAMAGLLQRTDNAVTSRLPGLGDLPVLGPLFRSVRYQQDETELVILVTASLVEPLSLAQAPPLPGATHTVPDDWELYLEGRIGGREPAKLDPASAQWLKDMGLDQLVGPGAWATYGESCPATGSACSAGAPAGSEAANKTEEQK